jgi:hypothetical protein
MESLKVDIETDDMGVKHFHLQIQDKKFPACITCLIQREIRKEKSFKIDSRFISKLSKELNIPENIVRSIRNSFLTSVCISSNAVTKGKMKLFCLTHRPAFKEKIIEEIFLFSKINFCHPATVYSTLCKMFINDPDFIQFAEEHYIGKVVFQKEIKDKLLENDIQNPEKMKIMGVDSKKAEDEFVSKFRNDLGIELKTEEEQVKERIEGQKLNTPDILFISPVTLNGQRIHWIEFKNNYCSGTGIIFKNQKAQLIRYHNAFGPGTVFYQMGVSENIQVPGILFLGSS